jgi:hypothetical protein
LRRERDISQFTRQAGAFKKHYDDFGRLHEHYKDVFAYEGPNAHPYETISNLLGVVRALRSGEPATRAEAMAEVIQQFGIDVSALDGALSKRVGPGGFTPNIQPAVQAAVQAQMAPFNQFIQGFVENQNQAQQQLQEEARTELESFAASPENEFFNDVKEDMADILEMATKRNQKISLQSAYKRAILLRSDLAAVVANRELQAKAAEATKLATAAKSRAVSVTGAPALGRTSTAKSLRDQIAEALENASE